MGPHTSHLAEFLAESLDSNLIRVPSGEAILTWEAPPSWIVNHARLKDPSGQCIADFSHNPLCLKSYSAAFSDIVSLEALYPHITSDPKRPDRTIYDYRAQYEYGPRETWGFSLPDRIKSSLPQGNYEVDIDVEFGKGTLDVVDLMVPGDSEETIFFCAHTCHPALVNDGIGCIAALVEVAHWVKTLPNRTYTYRFIFGPEFYGAAAFLEHAPAINQLKYGYYLDMLANGKSLAFAQSYKQNTLVDILTHKVLVDSGLPFTQTTHRKLWGNDEIFYDGPDFEIPTIALGRSFFDNYHTDHDNLNNFSYPQLEESFGILKSIINLFERDYIPLRQYKGPLYQSKYNLAIDSTQDPRGHLKIHEIQREMNGRQSMLEISHKTQTSFEFVESFCNELKSRKLLKKNANS